MLHTTFARAKEANACTESYHKFAKFKGGIRKWGKDTPFPLSEVLEVCGLNDALWALRIVIEPADREMRLFACDCAERVLPIFEQQYPEDNRRPRQAIETARRFALGKATQEELAAAWAAAVEVAEAAATWDVAWAAEAAATTTWAAARAAAATTWAAAEAAAAAAWAAAAAAWAAATWDVAWAAEAAEAAAARAAEEEWQKKRFIELLDSIPNP
jgi:hypothetical protein